jgi:hypothetical protein
MSLAVQTGCARSCRSCGCGQFLFATSVSEDLALEPRPPVEIQDKHECCCRRCHQGRHSRPHCRCQPSRQSRNERRADTQQHHRQREDSPNLHLSFPSFPGSCTAARANRPTLFALTLHKANCEPRKRRRKHPKRLRKFISVRSVISFCNHRDEWEPRGRGASRLKAHFSMK